MKTKNIRFGQRQSITFSDKELGEIGTSFTYTISQNQIHIHKNQADGEFTVSLSRKKNGSTYIPLVDLRNKAVREWLRALSNRTDTLTVHISNETIVIEPKLPQDAVGTIQTKQEKKKGVICSIQTYLQKAASKLRAKDLFMRKGNTQSTQQAVGDYTQLTFDFFDTNEAYQSCSAQEQTTLKHDLPIALEVADLFCGAGLLGTGFKNSGFDIKFSLDADESAIATHNANFENEAVCEDIQVFNNNSVLTAPIVIGGAPCQGFSNANRTNSFLDNPNNLLVREYIRAVKQNEHCKVFVLENVPQLLTTGNGAFKDEIIRELSDFEITYGVLNSADFGTAQTRKRAIMIGSKIGKIELPKSTTSCYQTVGEALEGLTENTPNQMDYSKPKADTVNRMRFVEQGGNWTSIPDEFKNAKMLKGESQSSIYKRLNNAEPSVTIVNPRKATITHPTENRILSVRECARLFDVSDTFRFVGKLSAMQQQICNGVPVKLSQAIANVVRIAVEQFNIRTMHKQN